MNPLWNQIALGTLTDEQLARLDAYLDALVETNKTLNLTRISDKADAEVRHVADALTLLKYLPPKGDKWPTAYLADVGTGGGVPGVILAIARPDLAVTLVDSTLKKLTAVAGMAEAVGVRNVRTRHARIEEVKDEFDVITARGVAALDKLVLWTRKMSKPAAVLLALKGPKAAEEVEAAAMQLKRCRLRAEILPVDVPELAGHCVVRVRR